MIEKYRKTGIRKPYLVFGLTDETYALLTGYTAPEGMSDQNYYFAFGLLLEKYQFYARKSWDSGIALCWHCGFASCLEKKYHIKHWGKYDFVYGYYADGNIKFYKINPFLHLCVI